MILPGSFVIGFIGGYVNYRCKLEMSIQDNVYVAIIPFKKMHGAGNQILVLDNRQANAALPSPQAVRKLAQSAEKFSFDQLMWIATPESNSARASYRVFNADGTQVEQCGNGLRCIAWMLASDAPEDFTLESPAGIVQARLVGDRRVAVSMGRPQFSPSSVPMRVEHEQLTYSVDVGGQTLEAAVLSMGNPHCVLDVTSVADAPVERIGAALQEHALFPERINVGFREVVSRSAIRLRVFERGVGETQACGTGACAAVVSGIRAGELDTEVCVALPGGELMVSWSGGDVWLTGDVELETEGTIEL